MIQTPDTLSESTIIERVLNGDKSIYELIVRRFNPILYKVGRSYNYSHEDTQDLMQDTFVDAYRNLAQFQGRAAFKTWLIRIMLNNCYRKTKSSRFKMESNRDIHENAQPMFLNDKSGPNDVFRRGELKNILEMALSTLPTQYRLVFSLREMSGLSTKDTATALDISEINVKVRLSRAKAMLRKELEKNYTMDELFDFNLIYCDAIVADVMTRIQNI